MSQAVKTSRSHEEGDKRFPKEIPKGEVPSAKKKVLLLWNSKKANVKLHHFQPTHTLSHFFLFFLFFKKRVAMCVTGLCVWQQTSLLSIRVCFSLRELYSLKLT